MSIQTSHNDVVLTSGTDVENTERMKVASTSLVDVVVTSNNDVVSTSGTDVKTTLKIRWI